ncbi:MAG TPA: EAL domain-containing protein [Acidimicrobiales bacterium]|nr:EAL domain-containing protein [Acidimicrobiales bacterium]
MRGWPEDPAVEVARTSWPSALRAAIVGDDLRCWFQPIVDVRSGAVVGYEALARMAGAAGPMGPAAWFAAARAHGVTAELEAACLAKALSHRPSLPPGCFLAVNVGPGVLAHARLLAVLEEQGDLSGVVLELTEPVARHTRAEVERALGPYRRAGAQLAVDETGTGHRAPGLLSGLRPGLVKLDRSLVSDLDGDEGKRDAVRRLSAAAGVAGARVVAEGVERAEELEVLVDLGVGLAQGYVLARPAPPWQGAAEEVVRRLRRRSGDGATLRDVVTPRLAVPDVESARRAFADRPGLDWVVVLDGRQRPTAVADAVSADAGTVAGVVALHVDTPLAEAGRRLAASGPSRAVPGGAPPGSGQPGRPRPARGPGGPFPPAGPAPRAAPPAPSGRPGRPEPLVCVDDGGRYVGIVSVERIMERLAAG